MEHCRFHYKTLDDVRTELEKIGRALPLGEQVDLLRTPCRFGAVKLPNRLGIAPMEGVDSLPDGAPSELTRKRYLRLAEGGAGLIWMEAVSVVQEGRSSLKQLYLDENTLPAFQKLVAEIKETGLKKNGFAPCIIMQANHSGRYSRPNAEARPEPITAYHRGPHEKVHPYDDSRIATDEYLDALAEKFGHAALLCREAGFDGIDIKSCHGYLFDELASAYNRPGRYGGSFENRFRLLVDSIKSAQRYQTEDYAVVARVGICDMLPYPDGFGMKADGSMTPDYTQPIRLVKLLHEELGVPFLNFTMGDPHLNSHVTRPYDLGRYIPEEHPLEAMARLYEGVALMKKACPTLGVSASSPTYLRQFAVNLAAGAVEQGVCDSVCFGRLSFANPSFPNEIFATGTLQKNTVCVTCSKCSELILAGVPTGCVVRDPDTYLPYYRALHQQ